MKKICNFCSDEFEIKRWESKRKYCNNRCQLDFQTKEKIENWKKTQSTGRISGNPQWLKNYILEKQNNSCLVCKIIDWQGKSIVFELEHIDGNSDNNSEENLCCLCPNCHSQTPTFKGANRGKGKHSRRERYKQGKSF